MIVPQFADPQAQTQMMIANWTEDTDDQAALKHTILAAISPVLLSGNILSIAFRVS